MIGYPLNNGACVSICNDTITAGTEQCDDGNNVDGDGCNADCTIGNNNGCIATVPYVDPITSFCSSTCPTGYFANSTTFSCDLCDYTC